MAKDSIDDFLDQMQGGGDNSVPATKNDIPIIKIKPVNEGQMPEIKTRIEINNMMSMYMPRTLRKGKTDLE